MDFLRVLDEATPLLLQGLQMTVGISLLSLLFGMLLGLFTCLMSISKNKLLKGIAGVYIWIVRGTPMIVQAFIVFFGAPQLIQQFVPAFKIDAFTAGVITLSLNAGAYLAEIFRGGIQAVPKGQTEAARSLGLSKAKTMVKVVLPQAFKVALPSMVNQFIITIKDTSILSVIGLADIVNRAKVYVGKSYQFFATYIFVAIYYLVVISLLMIVSKYLEKRVSYDRKG
ncbi:MAG: amino acid ABC transporter permease [Clostridia bacterium]|nr:amino acid ABC transporter permease [Clostridia bacterium]